MNVAIDLEPCSLWCYDIVPEKLYQPELGEYHTYGIRITSPGYTDILHDVSICKKTSERIMELLDYYQISPIHMRDVVTDLLP